MSPILLPWLTSFSRVCKYSSFCDNNPSLPETPEATRHVPLPRLEPLVFVLGVVSQATLSENVYLPPDELMFSPPLVVLAVGNQAAPCVQIFEALPAQPCACFC